MSMNNEEDRKNVRELSGISSTRFKMNLTSSKWRKQVITLNVEGWDYEQELEREARLRAFTLIELLCVIGVIAVLAGLLMPALGMAKRRANDAHCRNNLHQLGIAVRAYADEHDERFPTPGRGTNSMQTDIRLGLSSYLGGAGEVFKCREDKAWFERTGCSYDWNADLSGHLIDRTRLSAAGSISTTMMLYDHQPWHRHVNAVFVDGSVGPRTL